jgi:hypothetical protein
VKSSSEGQHATSGELAGDKDPCVTRNGRRGETRDLREGNANRIGDAVG